MANVLLSGPAGSGKSQEARRLAAVASQRGELTAIADFQAVYVAISGDVRDPVTGLYPARNEALLPLVEFTRQSIITGAVGRQVSVITTNSDGSHARREFLLSKLGPGAKELVVDPGFEVVSMRLADVNGELSGECSRAIQRWYSRK